MTHNSLTQSKIKAQGFENRLRQILKRYSPDSYGPTTANVLVDVLDNLQSWKYFPPHHLVHSIEANCAYYAPAYANDNPTKNDLRRIINEYKRYQDPFLKYALEEKRNLHLALLAIARQQFGIQKQPEIRHFARYLILFAQNNPIPKIDRLFLAKYGIGIWDWMYLSFAVLALSLGQKRQFFTADNFYDSEVESIPKDAIEPYLELASLTVDEVGQRYLKYRRETPPHLYIFIPSVFYEYPLIRYKNGEYLVTHPEMLVYHASERLFAMCAELDEEDFLVGFGSNFEEYVRSIIEQLPNALSVRSELDMQRASQGRCCDFALEFEDAILLVECKATRYSARYLTENAIANDNSTGKIANAYEQIVATAKRLKDKEISSLFQSVDKPIFGICVTFGEFLFPNSPFYSSLIIQRMSEVAEKNNDWFLPLGGAPQAMSIDTFEKFVVVLKDVDLSPEQLFMTQMKTNYTTDGDWDSFVRKFSSDISDWVLPSLQDAADNFFGEVLKRPNDT